MSTDVSVQFRALFACQAKELKDLAMMSKDLASTKLLTEKQIATRNEQEAKIAEINASIPKAIAERAATLTAANATRDEAALAKTAAAADLAEAKVRAQAAEEALASAKALAAKAAQPQKATLSATQRYAKFLAARQALTSDIEWRTWLLNTLRDFDDAKLKSVELSDAFAMVKDWPKTLAETDAKIAALAKEGDALADMGARSGDVRGLTEAWQALQKVKATQDTRLQKERSRREEVDRNIGAFVKEQGKLLQWCRQQKSQLESLTQTEHVQEFCGSLQSNNATMEANFLVLILGET